MNTTISVTDSNPNLVDTQMSCSTSSTEFSSELIIQPPFKLDSQQVILKSSSTSYMVELINDDQIEYKKRKNDDEDENENQEENRPKMHSDKSFTSKSNETSFKSSKFSSQSLMLDSNTESNGETEQHDTKKAYSHSEANLDTPDFSIQTKVSLLNAQYDYV